MLLSLHGWTSVFLHRISSNMTRNTILSSEWMLIIFLMQYFGESFVHFITARYTNIHSRFVYLMYFIKSRPVWIARPSSKSRRKLKVRRETAARILKILDNVQDGRFQVLIEYLKLHLNPLQICYFLAISGVISRCSTFWDEYPETKKFFADLNSTQKTFLICNHPELDLKTEQIEVVPTHIVYLARCMSPATLLDFLQLLSVCLVDAGQKNHRLNRIINFLRGASRNPKLWTGRSKRKTRPMFYATCMIVRSISESSADLNQTIQCLSKTGYTEPMICALLYITGCLTKQHLCLTTHRGEKFEDVCRRAYEAFLNH